MHFLSYPSSSIGGVMKPPGLEKSVGIISATPFKDGTDPQWQDTPGYKAWLAWMQKYNGSASSNGRRQPDAGEHQEADG
jgi:branched-chain amino acid transport system substrate-binding protein